MKIILLITLLAINIEAQVDTTDWKVLDGMGIALKYMEESEIRRDLLCGNPIMILQQTLYYLEKKNKDIQYLKEIRREYIDKLRLKAKKSK